MSVEHRFVLRMPEELYAELEASALAGRRSVNSEILWRLSGGLSERGELAEAPHVDTAVGLPGAGPSLRSESPSVGLGREDWHSLKPIPPITSKVPLLLARIPERAFRPDPRPVSKPKGRR